jgi:molybdopterin molybdotransferase
VTDPEPCSVEEHLERVLSGVRPLAPVDVPLLDALGLVCAEDVVATMSLPSFDNSAMDGYAVRHADVATASVEQPVLLPVVGEIGAGQAGPRTLAPGTAAKIMTGAPVPEGADAIVPYEWTDRGTAKVRIDEAPEPGQHVRPAGDDVAAGDLLVKDGTALNARHIGLLASVGRPTVLARPRPRVVVLSTGTELRDPGEELGEDSIYDGNSYMLAAAVTRAGGIPQRVGIVRDEPEAFLDTLRATLADADLVVTSGGVSQGDFDVVKEALRREGVWFGPVAMQPGKPQGFGLLGAGPPETKVPIVTLPGNSVSAYISFEVFVLPAIRTCLGLAPVSRPLLEARLTRGMTSPEGRRQFMRGQVGVDAQGRYVEPVGGPGSHLIGHLAESNSLIVVPETTTALGPGDRVQVLVLDGEI